MQIVNEGLKAGDLDGVVSNRFSIDQYKSKMGNDANIIVLAFTVEGQQPAKDYFLILKILPYLHQ